MWVNDFGDIEAREFFEAFSSHLSDDNVHSIVVYIDSYGGLVDSLAAMMEIVESSTKSVITVGVGKAFSAGGMFLALGRDRWLAPNSRMMLHKVRITLGDLEFTPDTLDRTLKEITRVNDIWLKKVVKRSKISWKEFNKKLDENTGDWYMSPNEALKYGFIDHIGLPRIKEVRQWILETGQ